MLLVGKDARHPGHIVVVDKGKQVEAPVQAPGIGAELAHEGMNDLEHVHAVETGEQPLVALIVGRAVQHARAHDGLIVPAQDLADQVEILLKRIRISAKPSDKVPVKAVRDVKPQSVDAKIVDPEFNRVENMGDYFLISEIELYQVVIALPALIPEAVIVGGVPVDTDMEPVLEAGIPSIF